MLFFKIDYNETCSSARAACVQARTYHPHMSPPPPYNSETMNWLHEALPMTI